MTKHQMIAGIEGVLALKGRSVSSFLSKLFGKAKVVAAQETAVSEGCVPATQKTSERQGGHDRPKLDWTRAKYVPLPPSPPTWEVNGRNEFHRERNDPKAGLKTISPNRPV